jgi:hypothetical protein
MQFVELQLLLVAEIYGEPAFGDDHRFHRREQLRSTAVGIEQREADVVDAVERHVCIIGEVALHRKERGRSRVSDRWRAEHEQLKQKKPDGKGSFHRDVLS